MPDIHIDREWACPFCNGSGTYAAGVPVPGHTLPRVEYRPCAMCAGTGDQRNAPPEWLGCPSRNRAAYHESLR